MDYHHHNQQQQQLNSSNHNQQHQHTPDQLPDEDIIEKLFPKCQPKQQQQRTESKSNGRYRHQNALGKQHKQPNQHYQSQQQHQQQRRQLRSHKIQQHSRKELEARRNARTNDVSKPQQEQQHPLTQRQKPNELQTNYMRELKHNRANYDCDSSDSSDELPKDQLDKSLINIKRSATLSAISEDRKKLATKSYEQPTIASLSNLDLTTSDNNNNNNRVCNRFNNTKSEISPSYSRNTRSHKAGRKYTVSKNFQKQIQRTHSAYGSGNQLAQISSQTNIAPLINLSSTEANIVDNNDTHTPSQQQIITPKRQSFSIDDKQEPTTSTTVNDSPSSRKMEKSVNRTSRGVVFLVKPDANVANLTDNSISIDGELAPIRHGTQRDSENSFVGQKDLPQEQSTSSIAPLRTSSVQSRAQQQTSNESAVSVRSETQLEGKISAIQSATNLDDPTSKSNESLSKQFDFNSDRHRQATKQQQIVANDIDTGVGQNDEDKYIDLFVYDNSPRLSLEEKPFEDQEQPIPNSADSNNNYNCDDLNESSIVSLQNHASQRLLAADQNEIDGGIVVRNDTSVEELCNFNDFSDGSKQKAIDIRTEKIYDNDSSIKTSHLGPESTSPIKTKSILRHHRSLGTLQTVDEKAEINIEDTEISVVGESSPSKLIDADAENVTMHSRNDLIKKGFVPPGFPQRIKPQFTNTNDITNHSSSPSHNDETFQIGQSLLGSPMSDKTGLQVQVNQVVDPGIPMPVISESNLESESIESHKQIPNNNVGGRDTVDKNLNTDFDKLSIIDQPKTDVPILRHHKLPNESSHFSIVKTSSNSKKSEPTTSAAPPRSSSVQFSILSDGESEPEAKIVTTNRPQLGSKFHDDQTKFVSPPNSFVPKKIESLDSNNANSPGSPNDGFPSAKSALIFPRLDEGLSSEAESCEDDVEDDDDRAMEADVDANDDDEEEDDIDDEVDSPIATSLDRGALTLPTNVSFSKHQPPKSRLLNSFQQSSSSNDLDHQQSKSAMPSYNNYIGLENLDQNDLKSQANFTNQNGQPNYWLNNSNQQATTSQPSSSSQFSMQKSNQTLSNSGNNMTRNINLLNKDDVKASNRLSSDTDNETDRLLGSQRNDQLQKVTNSDPNGGSIDNQSANNYNKQNTNSREVLIEGVLFNVKYLGSTHTECEGRGEKEDRITQAEMAVHEVKFRNGESSTPIEVQLFISTEKIMVLDDKHRKIMMDHSLRTISYIADIGNAIVLIVRKKGNSLDVSNDLARSIPKTTCHVFESHESHTITKSISQAFQVAYTELLKANGGDAGNYLPKELDYQEVLNSQEMSMTELEMFARKDNQREVIVPKQKGEILGLSIVESGWGSVLPTAVIASLKQDGPAYRCKKLSVGDQILSINGISLVGLALAECQEIIRKTRNQRVARLSVVPCPITVEVKIKRPDTKYQLGFSVQNGVICSLLRGGIAERGGVRVGHRIMSINGTTVVGVPHDKIVTLLASSVGEIRMKTCLTSLYRHMLGEEKAVFL